MRSKARAKINNYIDGPPPKSALPEATIETPASAVPSNDGNNTDSNDSKDAPPALKTSGGQVMIGGDNHTFHLFDQK